MTPDLMVVQLGSLFAAGHSPAAISGWTWPQVELAARGIQAYHLDLVARIVTGKSPALVEASRHAGRVEAAREVAGASTGQPGTPADVQKELQRLGAVMEAARIHGISGTSIGVKVGGGDDGPPG